MDDATATITATVNGGDPIAVGLRFPQFGANIPLSFGENVVVFTAVDPAGNQNQYTFKLTTTNAFRAVMTFPDSGIFTNGRAQNISGYLSATLATATGGTTGIASATVNGIPVFLGAPDANGNRSFSTSQPVPLPCNGSVMPIVIFMVMGHSRDAKTNKIFFSDMGDFIITQYEINGVKFEIQEDGYSVDVLIVPPKATDISKGAEDLFRETLRTYFPYPEKKLNSLVFDLRKDSVVSDYIYADANCDPRGVPEEKLWEWGKENDKWWWQKVAVCTDGKFIFFSFREYDGHPRRIMHGKLPDRW